VALGERFDQVLGAARAGAEWAWTELYRELAPSVLGYLRAQGAPPPEDVTGEVFLQLVRDLHRFSGGEEKFRSWVFTVAHHRLLDARRKAKRRPATPTADEDLESALPRPEAEPEALERLSQEEIVALLGHLTDDQRSVVLLRFVVGLSVPEVAEVVGKRQGTVKALQRRGLAQLEKLLSQSPYLQAAPRRLHG
jgi:RNA polymerase sigma-70 factor (ECF subfamily)